MKNTKKYFYSDGKDKFGPFSKDELKELFSSRDTLIWYYGLEDWVPLSQIDELKEIYYSIPPDFFPVQMRKVKQTPDSPQRSIKETEQKNISNNEKTELVNENLQDLNDWPKSGTTFNKFVDRKYSGTCLVANASTDIVSFNHDTNVSSKFLLGELVTQSSSGAQGTVTSVDPTNSKITLNSVSGTFTNGTVVGTESTKSFTVTSVVREQDVAHHYIDSNNLLTTIDTNNTAISNLKYERDLNEEKHIIRYIEPKYVGSVIKEFKELVRE